MRFSGVQPQQHKTKCKRIGLELRGNNLITNKSWVGQEAHKGFWTREWQRLTHSDSCEESGSCGGGKKWLDPGYRSPTGLADDLGVGCERKRGVTGDSRAEVWVTEWRWADWGGDSGGGTCLKRDRTIWNSDWVMRYEVQVALSDHVVGRWTRAWGTSSLQMYLENHLPQTNVKTAWVDELTHNARQQIRSHLMQMQIPIAPALDLSLQFLPTVGWAWSPHLWHGDGNHANYI
jgi:hypothetical protein